LAGLIIDDNDRTRVTYEGTPWEEVKHLDKSFGGRARWHYNNEGSSVTWRPQLEQSGEYEVLAWWGDGYGGLGKKVQYFITHANGVKTVYMNQNLRPGQWHSLGKYTFNAGTAGFVKMTDVSGDRDKFVVADAIKFVLHGSAESEVAKVAALTISPNGVISTKKSVKVTFRTSIEDASIRYTTDGNAPNMASKLYKVPFTLRRSATVRARIFKGGLAASDEAAAVFTIGAAKPGAEIIIDENDARVVYSHEGEAWEEVTHLNGSFGGGARWRWNNQGASVTWRFDTIRPGRYEVWAWWGDGYGGLGSRVPYLIHHADGDATVYMNQNAEPEQWHSLGQYQFVAGATSYVKMMDESGESNKFVVADAIKLVPVATRGLGAKRGRKRQSKKLPKTTRGRKAGKNLKAARRRNH
jgi:hypothetical protein